MKPTLFLLAAGMGSRYGGLKQLDGLGPNGETIMDYSIYDAIQAGFGKIVWVVMFKEENNFEIITPMSKAINIISAVKMTVSGNVSPYHILLTCANCMLELYYQFIKAY